MIYSTDLQFLCASKLKLVLVLVSILQLLGLNFDLLVSDPEHNIPRDEARKAGHETLVKRHWALVHEHAAGSVNRTLVFTWCTVHVAGLDNIDGTSGQSGAEAGSHGGSQVARDAVLQEARA